MLCYCENKEGQTKQEVCECGGKLVKIGKQACNDIYQCDKCGRIVPMDNGGCG